MSNYTVVAFHGSGTAIDRFDYAFTNQGNDQIGSGFYFTDSIDEAISYTSKTVEGAEGKLGGEDCPTVHVAKLYLSNPLDSTSKQGIDYNQTLRIIVASPCLEDALWNFEDLSECTVLTAARRAAKSYVTQDGDIELIRQLNKLAGDFFPEPGHIEEFNKVVQETLGYDSVVCREFEGKTHWVAWFPDQIEITDRVPADQMRQEVKQNAAVAGQKRRP